MIRFDRHFESSAQICKKAHHIRTRFIQMCIHNQHMNQHMIFFAHIIAFISVGIRGSLCRSRAHYRNAGVSSFERLPLRRDLLSYCKLFQHRLNAIMNENLHTVHGPLFYFQFSSLCPPQTTIGSNSPKTGSLADFFQRSFVRSRGRFVWEMFLRGPPRMAD